MPGTAKLFVLLALMAIAIVMVFEEKRSAG